MMIFLSALLLVSGFVLVVHQKENSAGTYANSIASTAIELIAIEEDINPYQTEPVYASALRIEWQRVYGFPIQQKGVAISYRYYPRTIVETCDGNIAVIARVEHDSWWVAAGGGVQPSLLFKIKPKGEPLTAKGYFTSETVNFVVIDGCPTLDNGFLLCGRDSSDDSPMVLKLDPEGNIQWVKKFSTPYGGGWIGSVTQMYDGKYAFAGYIYPGPTGSGDAWAGVIDLSGNLVWNSYWGTTTGGDAFYAIDSGWIGSNPYTKGLIAVGFANEKPYAVAISADGTTVLFEKVLSSISGRLADVSQTSDGGFITAVFQGSYSIIKLNATGDFVWGVSGYGSMWHIRETSDGGFVAIGESKVLRTDKDGNVLWTMDFGGRSIIQTSDGGYLILSEKDGYICLTKLTKEGTPRISIDPQTVASGCTLHVNGTGFPTLAELTVLFEDQILGTCFTDESGNFSATFVVPPCIAGNYTIKVFDENYRSYYAEAQVRVIDTSSLDVSITVSVHTQYAGRTANFYISTTLKGREVNVNELNVTVYLQNGTKLRLDTINIEKGLYKSEWKIPQSLPAGAYCIKVTARLADNEHDCSGSAITSVEVRTYDPPSSTGGGTKQFPRYLR